MENEIQFREVTHKEKLKFIKDNDLTNTKKWKKKHDVVMVESKECYVYGKDHDKEIYVCFDWNEMKHYIGERQL